MEKDHCLHTYHVHYRLTDRQTDGKAISITKRLLRNAPKKSQICYNSSICPHWTYFHKTRFRAYIRHIIVTLYVIYSKFCISQLSVFDSVRDVGIGANLYKLLWGETSPSLPLLTSPPPFPPSFSPCFSISCPFFSSYPSPSRGNFAPSIPFHFAILLYSMTPSFLNRSLPARTHPQIYIYRFLEALSAPSRSRWSQEDILWCILSQKFHL